LDKLAWAAGLNDAPVLTHRLSLSAADLSYRGFSLLTQAGPSSPELAEYQTLAGTGPRWRNLEGYHTRYGDVRELWKRSTTPHRCFASSGDELRMRFSRPLPLLKQVGCVILSSWGMDG
jgi:hypothetical protein